MTDDAKGATAPGFHSTAFDFCSRRKRQNLANDAETLLRDARKALTRGKFAISRNLAFRAYQLTSELSVRESSDD